MSRTPAGGSSRCSGRTPGRTERRNRSSMCSLASERLDDPDAGDRLLDLGRQLGEPLLDLLHGRSRAPVVAHRREHHERAPAASASAARSGLMREHHRARQRQRQRVLRQEDQPVAEEEADRLQVDRRPRHQLPGLLGVEEAELERLQVPVEAAPAGRTRRSPRPCRRSGGGPRSGPGGGAPAPTIASASGRIVATVSGGLRSRSRSARPATGSARSSPSPARRRPAMR